MTQKLPRWLLIAAGLSIPAAAFAAAAAPSGFCPLAALFGCCG
ncbi:MAG: hypothetical protein R3F59_11050 [Myxococcota bacterium]